MTTNSGFKNFFPLFLTIFLDIVGIGIAMPTLAIVLLDPTQGILAPDYGFQARSILYGFMLAAYPIAQFFGSPILGALSDRYGRKRLLQLSIFGTAIGYVMFAIGIYTNSILILFLSRLLDGFTGGNISIAQSAIADQSTQENKTRNFGLIGMAFGLGFILGPYLGGILSDPDVLPWFNLATPYWFAAGVSIVNMLLLWFFFHETLKTKVHTPVTLLTGIRNLKHAFALANLRTVFVVVFFFTLGFTFFVQFFQVFLIDKFAFDQGDIGNVFGFIGLCSALSQGLIVRPVSRKFAPNQVLKVSLIGQALALPFLLMVTEPAYLYAILPFIAICQGLTFPNIVAMVSNMSGAESQGEGLGLMQSVQALAQVVPPVIAGFVAAVHPNLPIVFGSACLFAAWLIFVTLFRVRSQDVFHEV